MYNSPCTMIDIEKAIAALDWKREPYGLYEPIEYTLASGGKRLRPQLVLLAAEMFGGKEKEVLPAALAIEVFHNFTLLHDDVMDKAAVRRGRPTVHVRWNDNTAILSGDQMVIEAYKLLSNVPADRLPQTLRLFNKMATEICEGQQYDMEFETRDQVSIEEYMHMIRLKTSVLLATALKIGAYIAGASETQQQALYEYGINIGLAFQIQDDILDVYGDPETFGKAIGGDICCNKKTYMLLTALQRADEATRAELEHWLQIQDKPDEKIRAVTDIYTRTGAREVCETVMQLHTHEALSQLDALPQNDATEQLRKLAEKLAIRKV